jgi:hypothetical protein
MGFVYGVASFQETTWSLIKLSGTYIKSIDSFGVAWLNKSRFKNEELSKKPHVFKSIVP